MLQAIREKIVGWVIWLVLAMVGVPFAFWGVDSFFLGGGDPVVARVGNQFNGQKIYQSQFKSALERAYQDLQRRGANGVDRKLLEKAVFDDMIQKAVFRRYARDQGYRATDAVLFSNISSDAAFQKDGKFDTATYEERLGQRGRTPQQYENELRLMLESYQLADAVIDSAFVTPVEAAQTGRLQGQERNLSYASFDPAKYKDKIKVTPEQVKQKYESSRSQYMAPERIKLAYVELALDALPKADPPGDDVLKVMYEAEKDGRFTTPDQRKARHILVNFGTDKSAAKAKIEALAAQLKSGKDFAELAKASSDDPGSKSQGGDLGWVKRGQMVKEFETVLFELKSAGQVSEPVESQFGWHLIRLDELKPRQIRPFSDAAVRQELIDLFQAKESQKRYQEYQDKIEQLAFESPTSLEPVAKELGLQVQTTDWFTRAGGSSGISAEAAVKQAAFSEEVLKDGENSKPLAVGENRVAVVRKAEYEAPRQRALEEVAAEVETALVAEQANAQAMADAEAVLAAAKGGKTLADAVKEKGADLNTPGLVKRDAAGIDRSILNELFKLPRPAAGAASYGKAKLGGSGAIVVLGLSQVQEAEAAAAPTTGRMQRDMRAGSEFDGYRKAVETEISVKRYEQPEAATTEEAEAPVEVPAEALAETPAN